MRQRVSSGACDDTFVLVRISNKSMYPTRLNFSALLTNIIHLILPGYGIKTVLNTFLRI